MCSKASTGIWPSSAALLRSLMALLKEHWGKKMNVVLIALLPEGFYRQKGIQWSGTKTGLRINWEEIQKSVHRRVNAITISKQTLNMKWLDLCIQSQMYECCYVFKF